MNSYDTSMYDNTYGDPTMADPTTAGAVSGAAVLVTLLFTLLIMAAVYVIYSLFLGRIFKKAGVEQWKAWVPIYNSWVMLELGGQKGFWAVLMLIPIVNIVSAVFMYIAMYNIGLKLGKDGAFVLLAIFVPIVWLIWLAVDKSTWQGVQPATAAAAPTTVAPAAPSAPVDQAPTDEDDEAGSVPPKA
jgi:hypothetical protein